VFAAVFAPPPRESRRPHFLRGEAANERVSGTAKRTRATEAPDRNSGVLFGRGQRAHRFQRLQLNDYANDTNFLIRSNLNTRAKLLAVYDCYYLFKLLQTIDTILKILLYLFIDTILFIDL
jgi:hypothetical protein